MAATSLNSSWQRAEPWLLMAVAFVLRALWIDNVAVEHFDEGVYASGYFSAHLDYQYPDQHLYAPPLFPYLLKMVLFYSGGDPHAVAWVNVVFGTFLVGAVWLAARDWFGQPAAFVAGTLLATNEFAIHFSRAILTDTLLCLWLTLGVWAGWKAIKEGGWRWIAAAGVLAALAWWTKYNGWLTLAITGAGTAGAIVFERLGWKTSQQMLLRWLGTAIIAGLLWSPYVWSLQPVGGYAAVAANHAGYFGGLGNWWDAAHRQAETGIYIIGIPSGIAAALLILIPLYGHRPSDISRVNYGIATLTFAFIVFLPVVGWSIYWLAIVTASEVVLVIEHTIRKFKTDGASESIDNTRRNSSISDPSARWHAAAWAASLSLAIPLYRPYPRLLLPWLVISIMFMTGFFSFFRRANGDTPSAELVRDEMSCWFKVHPLLRWVFTIGLIAVCSLTDFMDIGKPVVAYENRSSFADISLGILEVIEHELGRLPPSPFEEGSCVVYVLGEPGLYFHIAAARGRDGANHLAQPSSNLGMLAPGAASPGMPTFLVTGLHAHRDHPELLNDPPSRLKLLAEYPYQPSDLVLLDDMAPKDLPTHRAQVIRLWQIP